MQKGIARIMTGATLALTVLTGWTATAPAAAQLLQVRAHVVEMAS